jgi:hypothetical protein
VSIQWCLVVLVILPPPATAPTPAVIRPIPQHALTCPYMARASATCIPVAGCSLDEDCQAGQMCCSNGCTRVCVVPDSIPYYSVPLECPAPTVPDFVSTCDISCTDNSACGNNQLCCQNGGCGRHCTAAVQSTQPCFAVRELLTSGARAPPGAFVPACQDDGTFSPSQFHGSTGFSWCVNVQTGYPISPLYPRGATPQCSSERLFNICELPGSGYVCMQLAHIWALATKWERRSHQQTATHGMITTQGCRKMFCYGGLQAPTRLQLNYDLKKGGAPYTYATV